MKKKRALNKKGNLNQPVPEVQPLKMGKDHNKKVGVIMIVAVLAVGLLSILLLLGPKLFVGKAISYDFAGLNYGEAGIPPQKGTIAPGDLLSVPVAVNVGANDGNVFEFTLSYDPTKLTFNKFVSASDIIIVEESVIVEESMPALRKLKIVGTVQLPLGYQDVAISNVVEFGKVWFTVNEDITSSTSITFSSFIVLDESGKNLVTKIIDGLFELATATAPPSEEVVVEEPVATTTDCRTELSQITLLQTQLNEKDKLIANLNTQITVLNEQISIANSKVEDYNTLLTTCNNENLVLDDQLNQCLEDKKQLNEQLVEGDLEAATCPVCELPKTGDADGGGCVSIGEYNDFKYEFKNNIGGIACS